MINNLFGASGHGVQPPLTLTPRAAAHLPITDAERQLGGAQQLAASTDVIATGVAMMDGGEGAALLFPRRPTAGTWQAVGTVVDTAWSLARQALTGRARPCVGAGCTCSNARTSNSSRSCP